MIDQPLDAIREAENKGLARLGVYFIDAPHDYRSQLICLLLAVRYMSAHGVAWRFVRWA